LTSERFSFSIVIDLSGLNRFTPTLFGSDANEVEFDS
jgi:hypothetical protein